jgi:putative dehydrogenase
VVDAAQTEDVLFGEQGLARMLRPGHAVMLCPTIAPQDVESFAAGWLCAACIRWTRPCRAGRPGRATAP